MKNLFREKILNGENAVGTFFSMGDPTAVECLALGGMDFIAIDCEHGPFDVESSMNFVRAAKLRNMTPIARIKDCTRPSVLKMLDIGVEGLIIPCVQTVQEVHDLVEFGKYFPLGQRGVAFGRGSGWGKDEYASNLKEYFEICNRESLIIPQCETRGCLDHIEEITAIEGVDGIFIGPFDLSVALGKPAQFDTDEFREAFARIIKACKDAGKFCMTFAGNPQTAKAYFKQGISAVTMAMDTILFINAIRQLVQEVKS